MSQNQVMEDGNPEEEERMVSLRKKELEAFIIQIVDGRINQVVKETIVPMLSRIVNEAVELAAEKLFANMMHNSASGLHSSESRSLQLEFMDKLSLPVYTNKPIKGEGSYPLRVALVDGITKQVVRSGAEAFTKVEIVVVEGDLVSDQWTPEEFHQKIVREKEGKKSLLTGNMYLNLEEGIGYVRDISFTHNAKWMKVCELRLAAKVVDNVNGTRVREAVTEPFVIKDYRVTYNEKHYPPSLNDEIWRLNKIGKDGVFHNRLVTENIKTVKDFLTRYFTNPQSLQNILGTTKMWEATVDHAIKCVLDKRLHLYFPIGSEKKSGVVFNVVGQVMGLILECCYVPIDKLSEDQKAVANNLVVTALGRMEEVMSFPDETRLHSHLLSLSYAFPSISPRLESPSHSNCEPSHAHYGHDHAQPSTSSHNNQVMPFQLSDAANLANIPNMDSLGITSFDPSFGNSMNSVAQDDLTSIIDGFFTSRAADVAKAQRKWSMLYSVLRSKRKIAALKLVSPEAVLASKRPKIYEAYKTH